ncbi:DUF29 domain-containing protein [Escherichia coli]|nr:DUF29 domain-containing protein [Escherichia coli]HDI8663192.1 DUF29 domain-containing protein [Escherichia coli]
MTRYEDDFYTWTQEQRELLAAGRFDELDIEHLAEELDSMGASERNALESRLIVLLMHMLKWQYQPGRRGRSWQFTIAEQRRSITRHLRNNPGLKGRLSEIFTAAYGDARYRAEYETGFAIDTFPEDCPWTWEQVIDQEFMPQ